MASIRALVNQLLPEEKRNSIRSMVESLYGKAKGVPQTLFDEYKAQHQTKGELLGKAGPLFSALGPLESLADWAIRKEPNKFSVEALQGAVQRGGDIPGALMSRGMPAGMAMPLGIGAAIALPGAGELGALKRASQASDVTRGAKAVGEVGDLASEARKYKSAEEFIEAFNKKTSKVSEIAFKDTSEKIPKEAQRLNDLFMDASQQTKYQKMYEQGGNDTDVLKAIYNQAKGKVGDLTSEARKYKSAEEFVKSQSLYHGTPNEIIGGKLKFGEGKQLKKGGYMGGHFLTDTQSIAENFSFGGKVYQASGGIKSKVLDVNKSKNLFQEYVGKKYKTSDGEMVEFTKREFDYMFPEGKADWSTLNTDLAEQIAKKQGKIGVAIPEYAGGKQGMTYQIFEDNIPVYTKSQLTDIYNKAKGVKPVGEVGDLATEARKYKSAEEFIEAINNKGDKSFYTPTFGLKTEIGKPVLFRAYHGTDRQFNKFDINAKPSGWGNYSGKGIYFTPSKEGAEGFGGRVIESYLDLKNPYVKYLPTDNIDVQFIEEARDIMRKGHDGIIVRTGKPGSSDDIINEIVVFDTNAIKTKSQLTDIYNKAWGK